MSLKNFKSRNGIDVDSYTIPNSSFQKALSANTTLTIDTIDLSAFSSVEYFITLKQDTKIRSSKVVMHTDGTSVDMTEYAITETGGSIAGAAITSSVSNGNALLKVTSSDAATTTVLIKAIKSVNIPYAATVPDAPTIGTATAGTQQASVAFTAPTDNGGSSITGYTVTSIPGSVTANGSSSPIVVTGLTAETSYTFTVSATNSIGTSVQSSESNQITTPGTPRMAYFGGGQSDNGTVYSINKINMVNDTSSTLSDQISSAVGYTPASFSNSAVAGYFAFGNSHNGNVEKITFATDAKSSISASMPTANYEIAPHVSNSGQKGYVWRKWDGSSSYPNAGRDLNKFAFSTETNSVSSGVFNGNYPYITREALSNHGTSAYVIAGYLYKLNYSTETLSDFGNGSQGISGFRTHVSGISNPGTAGYYVGGTESGSSTIDKLSFTSDTKSVLSATLTANTFKGGTASRKGSHGYVSIHGTSNLNKLSFSTETTLNVPSVLASAPYLTGPAGITNDGVL